MSEHAAVYTAPVMAWMRQGLTGDRTPLAIDRLSGHIDDVMIAMARVPGLGHATVRHSSNGGWEAWLIQPPGRFLDREIRWAGDVAEVELLLNVSGEDRLVVEFHHLPRGTPPDGSYRPCAGCDSVGESCRAVGCPATRATPPGYGRA